MKVYVSVDMEGIAGISHPGPTGRADRDYPAAVELMTGEANAAVSGALAGGATEVVVNDAHGGMYNLTPEKVHPSARLVQGQKPYSMVEAATVAGDIGLALFVGYHARAGHPRGTIAHTYSGAATLTTLASRPVGEYGINALFLGALGVPVGMVTGDDALAEEVAEWLPGAERVVVKHAVSGHAADSLHPSRARELVEAGARRAVERAIGGDQTLAPLILPAPIRVGIDFARPAQADFVAVMPGMRREGDRGVIYDAQDGVEAFRAFVCAIRLAGLVTD